MKVTVVKEQLLAQLKYYTEHMKRALRDEAKPSALMFYGMICGAAEAMEAVGALTYMEKDKITRDAWEIYMGREVKE